MEMEETIVKLGVEVDSLRRENYFLRDKARGEVHRALSVVESLAGEGMTQKARVVVDSVIRRLREQEQNLSNPSRDRADTL